MKATITGELHNSIIMNSTVRVGIADDQQLFVKSMSILVDTFTGFNMTLEALNGEQLLKKLEHEKSPPDIIILDVNMPILDGVKTAIAINAKYPLIKMVALSQSDEDASIISMLKAGCCAYLLKSINGDELERALGEVHTKGYYNGDSANINFRRLLRYEQKRDEQKLSNRELEFLKLACTELTYKQVAREMGLAERTIDGYRESIFQKLNVQSRVGMAMEAIRRKLVQL